MSVEPPPLPIRTERLVLRTARPDDVDAVEAYWGDPQVTRYLPFPAVDRAGAFRRVARYLDAVAPAGPGDILFCMVELDGVVVGDVMLRIKAGTPPAVAEVGWIFAPSVAGRGYATEAARAFVDLAFDHYGCHRVEARLDPDNVASAALCGRLGMREEARTRRDFRLPSGEWADTAVYGLLREERPPG